jgi:hypothetical protein
MFSFSSTSEQLSAGLALTTCLENFVLDSERSKLTEETRPRDIGTGVEGCAECFKEEDRGILAVGVGVPATDERGFPGGGPIDPSIPRVGLEDVDELKVAPAAFPFTRTLFPRAGIFAVEGVSADLRSLWRVIPSLPESEMTEDGRDTLGVVNTDESRR